MGLAGFLHRQRHLVAERFQTFGQVTPESDQIQVVKLVASQFSAFQMFVVQQVVEYNENLSDDSHKTILPPKHRRFHQRNHRPAEVSIQRSWFCVAKRWLFCGNDWPKLGCESPPRRCSRNVWSIRNEFSVAEFVWEFTTPDSHDHHSVVFRCIPRTARVATNSRDNRGNSGVLPVGDSNRQIAVAAIIFGVVAVVDIMVFVVIRLRD